MSLGAMRPGSAIGCKTASRRGPKGRARRRPERTRSTAIPTQPADRRPATPGPPTSSHRKTNGTRRLITRAEAQVPATGPIRRKATRPPATSCPRRAPITPTSTTTPDPDYTDSTNLLTPVGAFAASPGPYGTFDMGGDVFQWNEAVMSGSYRGWRRRVLFRVRQRLGLRLAGASGIPRPIRPAIGFRVAGRSFPATPTATAGWTSTT